MGVAFGFPFGFILGNGLVWLRVFDVPVHVGPGRFPFLASAIWVPVSVVSAVVATRRSWPHLAGAGLAGLWVGAVTLVLLYALRPFSDGDQTACVFAAVLAMGVSLIGQRLKKDADEGKTSVVANLVIMALLGLVLPGPVAGMRYVDDLTNIRVLRSVDDFARGQDLRGYAIGTTTPDSGVACARIFLADGATLECDLDFASAPGQPRRVLCATEIPGDGLCTESWSRLERRR